MATPTRRTGGGADPFSKACTWTPALVVFVLSACASSVTRRTPSSNAWRPSEHAPPERALAAGPQDSEPEPSTGYDNGFFLRSADGRSELVFEGLFQTTVNFHGSDRDPSTDVVLKRMRPEFSGRFDSLRFRLEPKFTEEEVELEEAWVGTQLMGDKALLMMGRMKVPFNLEEVRSRRHIDFPTFSIINQFAPAEDHGLFLNGRSSSSIWEYGVAAYNGTGGSDTNSAKDFAARIMVHPFARKEQSAWNGLQLGLSGTIGDQDENVGGDTIDNEVGLEVVRYVSAATLEGQRTRAGLEAAWFNGPWMVQGEWMRVNQGMSAGGDPERMLFRGGYLTLSHVLTGESKSFGGVSPDSPFDFRDGSGRGAWVLALRLSRLDLDDDLASAGLVAPGTFTDRIQSLALGLNWIPNDHAIVRHALTWSRYDDEVLLDGGSSDEELAFVIEFQLHF